VQSTLHRRVHFALEEAPMKTSRWLLPFTQGVDMRSIEYAVDLAESAGAVLIPVSLISSPPTGARLEHIQQSKDFLEAVQHKAERLQVPVERYEVFTTDVLQSITTLVHDTRCDGIILVTSGEHTRLLQDEEVKPLLISPPAALVILRLSQPASLTLAQRLRARFLSWWRGLWERQGAPQMQDEARPAAEEPLWIRTEQHQR
jgi:hypothetical protein